MEYAADWEATHGSDAEATVSVLIDGLDTDPAFESLDLLAERELGEQTVTSQLYVEKADGFYPLTPDEEHGIPAENGLILTGEQQEAAHMALLGGSAVVEILTPFGTDIIEVWSVQTYEFSHITLEGERCFTLTAETIEKEIVEEIIEVDADSSDSDIIITISPGEGGGDTVPQLQESVIVEQSAYEASQTAADSRGIDTTIGVAEESSADAADIPVVDVLVQLPAHVATVETGAESNTTVTVLDEEYSTPKEEPADEVRSEVLPLVEFYGEANDTLAAAVAVTEMVVETAAIEADRSPAPLVSMEAFVLSAAPSMYHQDEALIVSSSVESSQDTSISPLQNEVESPAPAVVIHESRIDEAEPLALHESPLGVREELFMSHIVSTVEESKAEPRLAIEQPEVAIRATTSPAEKVAEMTPAPIREREATSPEHVVTIVPHVEYTSLVGYSPDAAEATKRFAKVAHIETPQAVTHQEKKVSSWELESVFSSQRFEPSFRQLPPSEDDIVISFEASPTDRRRRNHRVLRRTA